MAGFCRIPLLEFNSPALPFHVLCSSKDIDLTFKILENYETDLKVFPARVVAHVFDFGCSENSLHYLLEFPCIMFDIPCIAFCNSCRCKMKNDWFAGHTSLIFLVC